jgi:putative transposase
VTANPDGSWTVQQIRNLLMGLGDRAAGFRFLVRDRAGQFTESAGAALGQARHRSREDPAPKPLRERLRTTVRAHRQDRDHRPDADLRRTASAIGPRRVPGHHNRRRPDHGRRLRPPRPNHPVADLSHKRIKRQPVLGGLLNEYERTA